MKQLLTLLALVLIAGTASAQIDMGIPAAAGKGGTANAMLGNFDCIGINPSNLGWRGNHPFSFTVANVGLTAQSRALDFNTLRNALMNPSDTFSMAQKQEYANSFATPEGFNFTANINWFAASMYFPKFGGLAVNIRDRAFAHVTLSQNAADVMFLGANAPAYQDSSAYSQTMSSFFDGTSISMLHYREMNIAYGRKLFGIGTKEEDGTQPVEIFGGIGFKMLWGLGNVNANIQDGLLAGNTALTSTYEVDYGNVQNFTSVKSAELFNSVGQGTAIDFGFSTVINDKIRAAVSFSDIGQITWSQNVLLASDTLMPSLDSTTTGINSWDMSSQASYFFGDLVNYDPGREYTTKLPGRMRLGYGMKVGERIQLGADVVVPLNKTSYNLASPYIAIGAEIKALDFLKFHAGVAGNQDIGWNVPAGITIGPIGFFEIGLASGDVLTYFAKSDNPNLSFALGVIRFNFNKMDSSAPNPAN
jgi:hypothetical protein